MLTSIDNVRDYVNGHCCDDTGPMRKQWMCLSVSDSGIGMKANELEQMFEPYTQGDAATQPFVGTGLGLYICVSLCQQLGGFIACSSTLNRGTKFFVAAPVEIVHQGDHPRETKIDETEHASSSIIPIYGPILIVDDNKINVKILHRQLSTEFQRSKLHVELISAFGGEEGRQRRRCGRGGWWCCGGW